MVKTSAVGSLFPGQTVSPRKSPFGSLLVNLALYFCLSAIMGRLELADRVLRCAFLDGGTFARIIQLIIRLNQTTKRQHCSPEPWLFSERWSVKI